MQNEDFLVGWFFTRELPSQDSDTLHGQLSSASKFIPNLTVLFTDPTWAGLKEKKKFKSLYMIKKAFFSF